MSFYPSLQHSERYLNRVQIWHIIYYKYYLAIIYYKYRYRTAAYVWSAIREDSISDEFVEHRGGNGLLVYYPIDVIVDYKGRQ